MDVNTEVNNICVSIDIKGTKTKKIEDIQIGEDILIKGPFWNGVLGLKHILNAKNGNSVVIARGIGMAPMMPVVKKLCANGNKVTIILDRGNYKDIFVKKLLELYNVEIIECSTLIEGEITEELKELISKLIIKNDINLIHCSGADILIYRILQYIGEDVTYSCSNNAKMCCGEGACGACILNYEGDKIRRMCKLQVDPKYVFERRRLI
ncbi:oxidoreductase [Clostridium botulinum C/D str. BKT75002]|nr:oxidoreductase [Clostridium botulinum C/D str. BKT75002]